MSFHTVVWPIVAIVLIPVLTWARPARSPLTDPLADWAQTMGQNSPIARTLEEAVQKAKAQLEQLSVTITAQQGAEDLFDRDMIYFLAEFFNFVRPTKKSNWSPSHR